MEKDLLKENGWKFNFDYSGIVVYTKGDVKKDDGRGAYLEIDKKTKLITISTTDKGYKSVDVIEDTVPNISVKFKGDFENIDTLDYICKLIRLKV